MDKVFVNGTFDILHVGHVRLLSFAKSHGSELHVAVDSDRRVKQLKGHTRPINNAQERMEMLLSIRHVNFVYVFDTDEELTNLIQNISPTVIVVGSDWKCKSIVGGQHAKYIKFFDRIDEYSTTNKIQCIIDRR